MIDALFDKHHDKITGNSLAMHSPFFEEFSRSTCRKLSSTMIEYSVYENDVLQDSSVHDVIADHEHFRIIGFIDDTAFPCCKPSGHMKINTFYYYLQRLFYRHVTIIIFNFMHNNEFSTHKILFLVDVLKSMVSELKL